jgi:hypothetical protein
MIPDSKIVNQIVTELKANIQNMNIDKSSPLSVVVKGMEILDSYKELSGEQKKEYLLAATQKLSESKDDNEIISKLSMLLSENVIGNLVNIIADATKGKVNVNKIVATSGSCLRIFCMKK